MMMAMRDNGASAGPRGQDLSGDLCGSYDHFSVDECQRAWDDAVARRQMARKAERAVRRKKKKKKRGSLGLHAWKNDWKCNDGWAGSSTNDGWGSVSSMVEWQLPESDGGCSSIGQKANDFKANAEAMPKFGAQTIPPNDRRGSYAQFPVNGKE